MSISQNFADSYVAFESLRAAAKDKERHHGETMAIIAGEFDKYTVWADKSGAARSGKDFRLSLDYQLREASFYKDQVVKLLQNLQENTEKALSMLSDEQKNENDGQVTDPDAPNQRDRKADEPLKEQEKNVSQKDEVVDGATKQETENTVEDVPNTEKLSSDFWKLMSSINTTITTLEKVPVRNRNSINEVKDDELEGGIAREHFDILHVRDKLPDKNLDPKVITRLGKMITRRRQLLLSLRSRRDEFRMSVSTSDASVPSLQKVTVLDAPPNTAATENFEEQGDKRDKPLPNIRDSVLYAASEHDSISQGSTPEGKSNGGQPPQIPPRPRNSAGLGMTRFECKYCFMTPYIPSDTAWNLVDRVFENRDAWWEHEISHHRSQFYCNTPGHARYRDQATFQVHMREEHDAELVQDKLLARFRRPIKGQGGRCNLCSLETRDLKRHVARHLEQLALFSIPRSDFDEGDAARTAVLKRQSAEKGAKSSPKTRREIKAKSASAEEKVESMLDEMSKAKSLEETSDDDSTTTGTRSTFGPSPKDTATTQSLFRRSESRGDSPIPVPINNPYRRVGVLMFTWSDPRPSISFFDLEYTFRCRYHFDVRVEEIPTDGDVSQYFTRGVSDLIRDFSGRSDLMIIYYAGRARFLSRSQDLEFRSNRDFFEFDQPCASMSWKLIESKLLADNAVKSDVLAVLEDSAAIDFASGNEISQILETPDVRAASAASSSASSDNSGEEKRDRCFQFLTMRRTTPYPQASFTESMNQVLLDSTSGIDASDLAYHMTLQNEHGHSTRNPCYVFHRLNPPGRDIAIAPLPGPKEVDEPTLSDANKSAGNEQKGNGKKAQAEAEVETEADGDVDTAPASPAPSTMSVSNHPLVLMAKKVTLKPFVWPAQFNPYSTEYVSAPRTNRDRLLVPESASRSSPSPIARGNTSDDRDAAGPVVERKHFSLLHPRFPFRHQRDQRDQQERKQDIRAQQFQSFTFDQLPPSRQDPTPSKRRLPRRRKPNASVSDNNLDLPSTLSLSLSLSLPTPTLSLPAPAVPPNLGLSTYDRYEDDDNAAPGPTIERRRPSSAVLTRRNTIASTHFFNGGLYAPQQPRRLSRSTYDHMRSASQSHIQSQPQSRTLTLNPRNTDTRSIILDSDVAYPYGGVGVGGGYVVEEDAELDFEADAAPAPQIPTLIQRPPKRSSSRSSLHMLTNHGSFSRRRPLTASGSTPSLASTVANMLGPAPGPIYSPAPKSKDTGTANNMMMAAGPVALLSQASLAAMSTSPSPQAPKKEKEPQSLKRAASMSFRHSLSLRRSITGSLRRSATLIGVVSGVGSSVESTPTKAPPVLPSSPLAATPAVKQTEIEPRRVDTDALADAGDEPSATKTIEKSDSSEHFSTPSEGILATSQPPPTTLPTQSRPPPSPKPERISVIAPLPNIPSFPIFASSSRTDLASIPLPPAPVDDGTYVAGGTLRRSPWGSMRRGRSLRRSISGLFSAGSADARGAGGKVRGEKGEGAEGGAGEGADGEKKQTQRRAKSLSRPSTASATMTAQKDGGTPDDALKGGSRDSGVLMESSGNRSGGGGTTGTEDSVAGGSGGAASPLEQKTKPEAAGVSEMEKKAKKKRSRAELWAGFRAGVSRRLA
ncbi:uncharacterized protein BKA78DRAFT_361144 [Phyllosticta capitalensis]|uniref:uncharacterized protein n=1 Tax=Phyllosticta capitalensis TaxID=121624 RepID=UPI00312D23CA